MKKYLALLAALGFMTGQSTRVDTFELPQSFFQDDRTRLYKYLPFSSQGLRIDLTRSGSYKKIKN